MSRRRFPVGRWPSPTPTQLGRPVPRIPSADPPGRKNDLLHAAVKYPRVVGEPTPPWLEEKAKMDSWDIVLSESERAAILEFKEKVTACFSGQRVDPDLKHSKCRI